MAAQFACLICNHGLNREVAGASALLPSRIDRGCRYLVCGFDCESWLDRADEWLFHKYLDTTDEERERNRAMTTWHVSGSPGDVASS